MSEHVAPWNQPGYSDITAARIVGDELEIEFANGDVERVTLSSLASDVSASAAVSVQDGLSVQIGEGDRPVEISWSTIRSATDPAYAEHLRDLYTEENRRLGRRLKALREDRGTTQAQLARAMGLSVAHLSRIESGSEVAHPATVRALLRELNATLADIAGPDAPEVSLRTTIARAVQAGVPRDLASVLANAVPRHTVPTFLARAFAWANDALLVGVPQSPRLPVAVQFKAGTEQPPTNSPLVHLALSVARLVPMAFNVPAYDSIPNDPALIRREAIDSNKDVTLRSLLTWTWSRGIAVLPLEGKGEFAAAVLQVDDAPVVIIKETRDFAVFCLFDLAHELGHIANGHIQKGLIDVESPTKATDTDADEWSATAFALELLLPNHLALLEAIRADARGDGVQFKFAVERVADRAKVSRGLLGIVAAFALPEIGRPLDRWGSAINLSKPEGRGREVVRMFAQRQAVLDRLEDFDAALIRTAVLGDQG